MSKARECAKDFIRYYVQRGDDMHWLISTHAIHGGPDYCAQIGGGMTWNNQRKKIADDRIAITEIEGVPFFDTFPVKQLWKEIQDEIRNAHKPKQMTLF